MTWHVLSDCSIVAVLRCSRGSVGGGSVDPWKILRFLKIFLNFPILTVDWARLTCHGQNHDRLVYPHDRIVDCHDRLIVSKCPPQVILLFSAYYLLNYHKAGNRLLTRFHANMTMTGQIHSGALNGCSAFLQSFTSDTPASDIVNRTSLSAWQGLSAILAILFLPPEYFNYTMYMLQCAPMLPPAALIQSPRQGLGQCWTL